MSFAKNLTEEKTNLYPLPLRVANEPNVRSFQYKVLNYILFTNDRLFKIGYVSNPNCTFCQESRDTIHHILFECSLSKCFWSMVSSCILNRLGSCVPRLSIYRTKMYAFLVSPRQKAFLKTAEHSWTNRHLAGTKRENCLIQV